MSKEDQFSDYIQQITLLIITLAQACYVYTIITEQKDKELDKESSGSAVKKKVVNLTSYIVLQSVSKTSD